MEIIDALAVLWRRKLWILLGAIAAAAVAVGASVALKHHSTSYGVASSELIVDYQQSTLGDATENDAALTDRGATFAALMGSPAVMQTIMQVAHFAPGSTLSVTGPAAPNASRSENEAATDHRAYQVATQSAHYSLEVDNTAPSPVISLYAEGPTTAAAVRLAAAVPIGFRKFLRTTRPAHVNPNLLITVRGLGTPVGKHIGSSGTRYLAAIGGGAFLFVVWCFLVLGGDRIRQAMRVRRAVQDRGSGYVWSEDFADREPIAYESDFAQSSLGRTSDFSR